jgi:protein TonB
VEQMPTFPNGETAMMKYLRDNIKYPNIAREMEFQAV